jgi:hypothetical protein
LEKRNQIRGDKLRELLLMVYLNNKYGLGTRIEISKLKQLLGYSQSGIYSALDESGYFDRKVDEIRLSEEGEKYVKKEIVQQYKAFNTIGYLFIFVGLVLILQWYLLTFHGILLTLDWYSGAALIAGGLIFRFALLPADYWLLKVRGKV